jgi:MazG family protein
MTVDSSGPAGEALERLISLVAKLRSPDGCPWDREQTLDSVSSYLLEEAYEAVEAVESKDPAEARGELGDVLFQVVFLTRLYQEEGSFDLAGVIEEVEAKMIRRHPHVFGPDKLAQAEQVKELWGQIKAQERGDAHQGLLDSVPVAAPGLVRAQRLGGRAARVGFDWADGGQVWEKVREELGELNQARDKDEAEAELGDVFFALAQWARHRGINPEAALRRTNARFIRRFAAMERLAEEQGGQLAEMTLEEQDRLWERAKELESGDR